MTQKENPAPGATGDRADGDAGEHRQHGPSDASCPSPLEPDREQGLLNAARAYAAAGLVIVPTNHDKVALIKWKKIDRPPTEAAVRRLWRKWLDAWIGLLTGHRSGLDVVDLDAKANKNGFDAVPEKDRAENYSLTDKGRKEAKALKTEMAEKVRSSGTA